MHVMPSVSWIRGLAHDAVSSESEKAHGFNFGFAQLSCLHMLDFQFSPLSYALSFLMQLKRS